MTDLERDLRDLGHHLDVPEATDLSSRVAAAVRVDRSVVPLRLRRRRYIAAAIGAAAALLAGTAAGPAVADWLGVRGIVVKQVQEPVAAAPPLLAPPVDLGQPMTLTAATTAAGFDVLLPARMGEPDETWFDELAGVPVVSLVYEPRPGLPAVGPLAAGALLTELRAPVDESATISKHTGPGTVVEEVTVGGERGLWIEGIHTVMYEMPGDTSAAAPLWLANRVLLWERGDLTLRLETGLDRDAAVRLAETVA